MTAILFQPHSDDCTLFSAYNALLYKPKVITVLSSVKQLAQGIEQTTRLTEDLLAMSILGCELEQWPEPDVDPDWEAVTSMMRHLNETEQIERVFAPAVEDGGHDQHSMIGVLAGRIFDGRVTHYMTYIRGHGKSEGRQVIPEPEWIWLKLQALACYKSQIQEPSTRPWFTGDIKEYVA